MGPQWSTLGASTRKRDGVIIEVIVDDNGEITQGLSDESPEEPMNFHTGDGDRPSAVLTDMIKRRGSPCADARCGRWLDHFVEHQEFGVALMTLIDSIVDETATRVEKLPSDTLSVIQKLSKLMKLKPEESRLDELRARLYSSHQL